MAEALSEAQPGRLGRTHTLWGWALGQAVDLLSLQPFNFLLAWAPGFWPNGDLRTV